MTSSTLTDFERGWISALIDGEGSLRLRERDDSQTYKPSIAITNTSREILEKFQEIVPDPKIYDEKQDKDEWNDQYQLAVWKHSTIRNLLEQIEGRMVIKKQKAKLMTEFLERRAKSERSRDEEGHFISSETDPEERRILEDFRRL
ncbi:MAG: LAGLIDADG family homing endonuclease [Candidatus Nanohaloarchaea archaeon]